MLRPVTASDVDRLAEIRATPEVDEWWGDGDVLTDTPWLARRGPDGTWHDGLLMDLLADELT